MAVTRVSHACLLIELGSNCMSTATSLWFKSCADNSLLKSYHGGLWKNIYRSRPFLLLLHPGFHISCYIMDSSNLWLVEGQNLPALVLLCTITKEHNLYELKKINNIIQAFYAPTTLEKLEGHIAFGFSVRPSVRAFVQNLLRYSFEISYMDSSSKNNWRIFFMSGSSPFVELCPF